MLNRLNPSQRGMSLVGLMIGIAVGLIILSGLLKLYTDYINSNRMMLTSTRLTQELRSVTDLIARDIRRAGYWGNATAGIASSTSAGLGNDYSSVQVTGTTNQNIIAFRYAGDTDNAAGTSERFQYRLNDNGVIQLSRDDGSTWDDLTDSSTTRITRFAITPVLRTVSLEEYCLRTCGPSCPTVTIREYDILVEGQSRADASLTRQVRKAARVRADEVAGSCPT